MKNKYYSVIAINEDRNETLFGSYEKMDCVYEIDAEKELWTKEGYKNIKIVTSYTNEFPDRNIYANIIKK